MERENGIFGKNFSWIALKNSDSEVFKFRILSYSVLKVRRDLDLRVIVEVGLFD